MARLVEQFGYRVARGVVVDVAGRRNRQHRRFEVGDVVVVVVVVMVVAPVVVVVVAVVVTAVAVVASMAVVSGSVSLTVVVVAHGRGFVGVR